VYASTDPLVTITEYAFYEALRWQDETGKTALLNQGQVPPFVTRQRAVAARWLKGHPFTLAGAD
jgi:hypothetical protein